MSKALKGRIIQGIGGYYTVVKDECKYICRARGNFRAKKMTPMVGDFVEFLPPNNESEGYITNIVDRRNHLKRPLVANIDMLVIVLAAAYPNPDFYVVDTLLINATKLGIDVCLIVNKRDLDIKYAQEILDMYTYIDDKFIISTLDDSDFTPIANLLKGLTFCLAGQSGVGKSSILNKLLPDANLKVGDISRKNKRGRHTTRQANLIPYYGGYAVDSPGFSMLELDLMDPNQISNYYPDFVQVEHNCKFSACAHNTDKNCGVYDAVQDGKIDKSRYNRYLRIYNEMKQRWKRRYD